MTPECVVVIFDDGEACRCLPTEVTGTGTTATSTTMGFAPPPTQDTDQSKRTLEAFLSTGIDGGAALTALRSVRVRCLDTQSRLWAGYVAVDAIDEGAGVATVRLPSGTQTHSVRVGLLELVGESPAAAAGAAGVAEAVAEQAFQKNQFVRIMAGERKVFKGTYRIKEVCVNRLLPCPTLTLTLTAGGLTGYGP